MNADEADKKVFDRVFGDGARDGLFDKPAEILEAPPGGSADEINAALEAVNVEDLEDLTDEAIESAEEDWITEQMAIDTAEVEALDAYNLEALLSGSGAGICPNTGALFTDCNCPDCHRAREPLSEVHSEILEDEF